jgi:hypothetical protein
MIALRCDQEANTTFTLAGVWTGSNGLTYEGERSATPASAMRWFLVRRTPFQEDRMKLAILAAALAIPASVPLAVAQPAPVARNIIPPQPSRQDMPNAYSPGGAGCTSITRQVEMQRDRVRPREDGRTLDREPLAFGFLAVDRNVGGCREVTFLQGAPRR